MKYTLEIRNPNTNHASWRPNEMQSETLVKIKNMIKMKQGMEKWMDHNTEINPDSMAIWAQLKT